MAEIPKPIPTQDELLIQVSRAGSAAAMCMDTGYDGSTGRRIPPIVIGHEAAGVVTEVGSELHGFASGDRVTFDSTVYCGRCEYCVRGQVNLSNQRQVIGGLVSGVPPFRRIR